MIHVELNFLAQYLGDHCRYQMEPVLTYNDNSGRWWLAFQKCDVGFPFKEFHAITVNSGCIVELPLEQWMSQLQGIDCVKVDLRRSVPPATSVIALAGNLILTCQNCGATKDRSEFTRARDLLQRIELGESFTDSECGECGALAHPNEKDFPVGWHIMEMFLRKVDEYQSNLSHEESMHDLSKLAMSLALMSPNEAVHYAREVLEEMGE